MCFAYRSLGELLALWPKIWVEQMARFSWRHVWYLLSQTQMLHARLNL